LSFHFVTDAGELPRFAGTREHIKPTVFGEG
jgi:hypothetical protein